MEGKVFGVILLAAVLTSCSAVKYIDCGSVKGKISAVDIPGCSGTICPLHKGTNATVSVSFTPSEDVTKVSAVVHGILSGIPVPFPLDNPDGCKDSGLTCPLKSGQPVNYKTSIFVRDSYPKVRLVIKWELKDQNSDDVICFEIGAEIVDGAKKSQNLVYHPRSLTVL